jgi:hypothetical protein
VSVAGRILLVFSVLIALVLPGTAVAAPPANDAPGAAAAFEPFTAENGTPGEQHGSAEFFEATPDPGVPRCLGGMSFERTVWFRVPEGQSPQEVTVEAAGRTLDVVDLAAFVQPPPGGPLQTLEPNACAGIGAGGSDAGEEPTSAVTLRVPALHPVLIQVGRRGTRAAPEDERALVSLEVLALSAIASPPGDVADRSTPQASASRPTAVPLAGATLTGEDPAQPACPSLGSVWRKFTPGRSGRRLVSSSGSGVETLTVFAGSRPTGENALDCVNREGRGTLEMAVPVKRRRPVWVRIGTDRPANGATASLRVEPGENATVIDGGPGGYDPTPGGPAGGFPNACLNTRVERARITGPSLGGPAGAFNRFRRVPIAIRVRGASVCDAEVKLFGPRGHLFARGRAVRLTGRSTVHLPRLRTFRRGRYRLAVTGVSATGTRVKVRTRVRGTLR